MPPSPNKHTRFLSIGSVILLLIGIGLLLAVVNGQKIADWWKLHGYQPPATVARLADQDTMKPYTRHLFYLNKPQLPATVASFRQHCPENKDTIVLGCYHPDQNGIYIYNVQDPALAGIQQVTAAHEVLHAVYARLSNKQRTALDSELQAFYKHGLTNPRVLAEVKLYQQTEPTAVMDEMSCTFGTELPNLPPALEAYYKQYFTNRAAIVAYEQRYEGEFTSRQNTITTDDQQLSTLKSQITAAEDSLNAQLSRINDDRTLLDGVLAKGETSSYNLLVPGFNQEIQQ